jgi:hypothetical protein
MEAIMPPDISHGAQVVIPAAFSSTAGAHQQHLTNHLCEVEKLKKKKNRWPDHPSLYS